MFRPMRPSDVEVQLVLQRGRGQTSLVNLATLDADPGVNQVVGEDEANIKAGKISADARDAAVETFKANPENARKIFGSVPERTKLSSLAGTQGGDAGKYAAKSWDELDRAGLLAELKANHPDLYEKKYKEMAASLHICRG